LLHEVKLAEGQRKKERGTELTRTGKGTGRLLRAGTAVTGILILVIGLCHGLSTGAELTEVLGFVLTMASLASSRGPGSTMTEEEFSRELGQEVARKVRAEAKERKLPRDFVPLAIVRPEDESGAGLDQGLPAVWSADEFRSAALDLFRKIASRRLVVVGERGSGKSVFSMMLALAVLDARDEVAGEKLPIPLPVSIGSWRPGSEQFAHWFERHMLHDYPVIRQAPKGSEKHGAVWDALFSCRAGCIPILDGLDEIRAAERAEAVRQLAEYFGAGEPFVLLSRHVPGLSDEFLGSEQRLILPVPAASAARYFECLETAQGVPAGQLAQALRGSRAGRLGSLLRRPLYLDMVRSLLASRQVSQAQLVDATAGDGAPAPQDTLIGWSLGHQLLSVHRGGARKMRYLAFMARQMTRCETNAMPWWRLADAVPASVMIASAAILAALPSYLLALRMPVGLTRGLAIGVVSGIAFGTLRGRPVRWRDMSLVAVALPVALAVEGVFLTGLRQGIADAVEISAATLLAIAYRGVVFTPPWAQPAAVTNSERPAAGSAHRAATLGRLIQGARADSAWESAAVVAAIGLVTTGVTALASALMHFHDTQRNPVTIFMAAAFGIGIAALAGRLLIVSPDRMQPSTVLPRRDRRVGGWGSALQAGLISAVTIGVGGGVSGVLRFGLAYGTMMTIVFGLVLGVPAGLVGTVIRWLSAPPVESRPLEGKAGRRAGLSTLHTDMIVTAAAVVGIGAAAAAGIEVLTGPLHSLAEAIDRRSSFIIIPADGILFGLTIGFVVACFMTAWPTYVLAHAWLVLTGRAPVRLQRFFEALQEAGILRREGSYLLFRHFEFQRYLSSPGKGSSAGAPVPDGRIPETAPPRSRRVYGRAVCWLRFVQRALLRRGHARG
jgi:hypothetical protein